MNNLQNDIIKTKKIYEEIFFKAQEAVDKQIDGLKRASLCSKCKPDCKIDFNKVDVFTEFPEGCRYRFWQEAAIDLLENNISKDILEKIQLINKRGDCYECGQCASCCHLASSEFSYEELKIRAVQGDKFSKEFISVFIPYESVDEAKEQYPDYVSLVLEETDGKVYFYHCPKVTKDGLCGDYENRPEVCRDFPNNPLVALPLKCSFNAWKGEVEITALMLHALIDIIGYYQERIKKAMSN